MQKNGGELPRSIREQNLNKYIKEIGEMVGFTEMVEGGKEVCINEKEAKEKNVEKIFRKRAGVYPKFELMTSHICRRSFATNLHEKIPTPTIMAITGHSTEVQFLAYIKKTNAEKVEALREYYEKTEKENDLKSHLKIV